jgi:aspartyl-tRNA(Asn)/glutamyl-tRNA(Gln) amidotransferase subunit C
LALSREEVQHIAQLARVGLDEDEIARFREHLSEILDYFQRLRQVDTEGVPPTAHTLRSRIRHKGWNHEPTVPAYPKSDRHA